MKYSFKCLEFYIAYCLSLLPQLLPFHDWEQGSLEMPIGSFINHILRHEFFYQKISAFSQTSVIFFQ